MKRLQIAHIHLVLDQAMVFALANHLKERCIRRALAVFEEEFFRQKRNSQRSLVAARGRERASQAGLAARGYYP